MAASSENNRQASTAASQVMTAIVVVSIVPVFAFSLGLLAGHLRAKTGSLLPAVLAHMLANLGGMIGGIVYRIATL